MRKNAILLLFLITLAMSFSVPAIAVSSAPDSSAESAIVMDADTGTVIFERNADSRALIASTTKIMTALIVLENCDLDETVVIKKEYTNIEGSSLYLKPGETFTVEELLYGLMLASGNDAAVALACHTSGSVEAFAKLMNAKAADLELQNSSFKNPHGLDDEGHYSSARDLALIACEAIKNAEFRKIVSTKSAAVNGRVLANHNKLLWKYKGVFGVKTGYTMRSGRSLVSCAERDGTTFIAVTINDRNDWDDHMAFYDWAFENYKSVSVLSDNYSYEIPAISGETPTVTAAVTEDMYFLLTQDQSFEIQVFLPEFLFAPVQNGDIIGKVSVIIDGKEVQSADIICNAQCLCDESVKLGFWQRIWHDIKN